MITQFKIFENKKPEIDEKTIRVENKEREWYIDFYFDDKNQITYIDNKWDVGVPNWVGFGNFNNAVPIIRTWAKKYDDRCEVYNIYQHNMEKYNL